MESIGSLVRQNEHSPPSKDSNRIHNRLIARVWTRMAEVYGHKWVSQYGECSDSDGNLTSAAKTWAEGLASLGDQEMQMRLISRGFSKIVESGDEWPPSLPQFLEMCHVKRLAPYHRIAKLELPAPTDPELARATLAEIKSKLSMSNSNITRRDQSGKQETKKHLAE